MEVLGHDESIGKIKISTEVLEVISSIAVLETKGVSSLQNNLASGTIEKIGKKYRGKGIRVDESKGYLKISAYVNLSDGRNVHKIAENIQENIKQSISTMLDINVIDEINVHIVNIAK
ncbi:Asp23/Gls24 family envelope stress response protein [Nosocomiicoccus massiliensis]|uniref:Asp23/Gls24 family envelope stress response protein n=1 Tax=Nosocomiicoccus massiliensis TaxID=1232430 RepID=UPI0003F67F7D|nr:Asp23/Gls24 family envelope stress response protein [Nosocomiicoccus massiliensis]